jgi:hypothetical protein
MDASLLILHGRDEDALLETATSLVARASASASTTAETAESKAIFGGERETVELVIPGGDWGVNRRVTVERKYAGSAGGALLVRVPEPVGRVLDSSSAAAAALEGCCNRLHLMRCIGVLEVCKEFASRYGVGGSRRRAAIVHMACRLPPLIHAAIGRLAETSSGTTLFVLTCTKRGALDRRLVSRGTFLHVPNALSRLSLAGTYGTVGAVATALAAGKVTSSEATQWLLEAAASDDASDDASASGIVSELARADHLASLVKGYGGRGEEAQDALADAFRKIAKAYGVPTTTKQQRSTRSDRRT